jgi:hypothetical protein
MDSIRGWCAANLIFTKLKSLTLHEKVIKLIVFTNYVITHTDSIKDLRVLFGTTFFFSITQNVGTRTYIWEPNEERVQDPDSNMAASATATRMSHISVIFLHGSMAPLGSCRTCGVTSRGSWG